MICLLLKAPKPNVALLLEQNLADFVKIICVGLVLLRWHLEAVERVAKHVVALERSWWLGLLRNHLGRLKLLLLAASLLAAVEQF